MTAIICTKCTDGVVIGADSMRSTAILTQGLMLNANTVHKILADPKRNIIVTTAGEAKLGERFKQIVMTANLNVSNGNDQVTKLMNEMFRSQGIQPPITSDLSGFVGFVDDNGNIQCAEYDGAFFSANMNEQDWYKATGSGLVQTLPLMRLFVDILSPDGMPKVGKAKVLVYWALKQAILSTPGLIGPPIRIATIKKDSESNTIKTEYLDCEQPSVKADFETYIEKSCSAMVSWDDHFFEVSNDDIQEIPELSSG